MEQKDIDIYEILKGMPNGIGLYTPMCGRVDLTWLATNKEAGEAIGTENRNGEFTFNKEGKYLEDGEVLLFPSNEMRDWSKFFKKGDVLVLNGNARKGICIFDSYEDEDTKLDFTGMFALTEEKISETSKSFRTSDWVKRENPASYIKLVEERLGGKLNLETMKVEKQDKPVFEVGKLYVFDEEDEDGKVMVIGKLIDKDESKDTLTFGNQYEIENEKFVTDQAFDLDISLHEVLREATEGEAVTFQKACTLWEKSKKQDEEQPTFKPFDKVLVRCGKGFKWLPAFFTRDRGEDFKARYNVLPLHSGKAADFAYCIPFEGHENFAFTDYDFVDMPL